MKRRLVTGLLVGLVAGGLLVASAWSAQGMVIYSEDDPNDGGNVGPERMWGTAIQPVWLEEVDPNEPIDPNEPSQPSDPNVTGDE